jgi:hypothetical protein
MIISFKVDGLPLLNFVPADFRVFMVNRRQLTNSSANASISMIVV